ncbi:streptococcal hemagglutinin-like [Palaemon carinicauda]|uniref:streptococcal hemagglutinin-like n=1 Tax=Palaemon carinicauda TaxID=392227 RepID=UPI0035B57409
MQESLDTPWTPGESWSGGRKTKFVKRDSLGRKRPGERRRYVILPEQGQGVAATPPGTPSPYSSSKTHEAIVLIAGIPSCPTKMCIIVASLIPSPEGTEVGALTGGHADLSGMNLLTWQKLLSFRVADLRGFHKGYVFIPGSSAEMPGVNLFCISNGSKNSNISNGSSNSSAISNDSSSSNISNDSSSSNISNDSSSSNIINDSSSSNISNDRSSSNISNDNSSSNIINDSSSSNISNDRSSSICNGNSSSSAVSALEIAAVSVPVMAAVSVQVMAVAVALAAAAVSAKSVSLMAVAAKSVSVMAVAATAEAAVSAQVAETDPVPAAAETAEKKSFHP